MAKTKQMGLRLSEELISRIDEYLTSVNEDLPRIRLTRADAIRMLLEIGLEKVGISSKKK